MHISSSVLSVASKIKVFGDTIEEQVFAVRRKLKKQQRAKFTLVKEKLPIGILCVKRIAYAELAIKNCNSLHFLNPNYRCYLYCDRVCSEWLRRYQSKFDYPDQIIIYNRYKHAPEPWQTYKLDALQQISRVGGALVDADSRWFAEPNINPKSAWFLAPAYFYKNNAREAKLLAKYVTKKELQTFSHYATGFIFLPKEIASAALFQEIHVLYGKIQRDIKSPSPLRRLLDEIAITVVVQQHIDHQHIRVLKDQDGPGNRHILQSYYYGCWHGITE